MQPGALSTDRAEAMSVSIELVHAKRGSTTQLKIQGRDALWVNCADAPTVCGAPHIQRGDRWDVLVQRVGLFESAWLLSATRDGQPVADLAVQARVYRWHKALLGWLSVFAAALTVLLAWAGPYRSPDRQADQLTLWP